MTVSHFNWLSSQGPFLLPLNPLSPWLVLMFFSLPHLSWQHFHDGRKAQQHIESSWKQLESVSDLINHAGPVPRWREAVPIGQLLMPKPKRIILSVGIYRSGNYISFLRITGYRGIKWTWMNSDIKKGWKQFKGPNRISNALFRMERSSLTLLFKNNEKVLNAAVLQTFTRGSTSPGESVSARKDTKPGLNPGLRTGVTHPCG